MIKTATFSPCRSYRYTLGREWDPTLPTIVFVGLNPSTADEERDDPTIRKCIGFAKLWGYGGIVMLNLFAFRATKPADMKRAAEPIGELNRSAFIDATKGRKVVAAWGVHGSHRERSKELLRLATFAGVSLECLGTAKDGEPRHPLYLPYTTPLEPWA